MRSGAALLPSPRAISTSTRTSLLPLAHPAARQLLPQRQGLLWGSPLCCGVCKDLSQSLHSQPVSRAHGIAQSRAAAEPKPAQQPQHLLGSQGQPPPRALL